MEKERREDWIRKSEYISRKRGLKTEQKQESIEEGRMGKYGGPENVTVEKNGE